MLNFRDFAEKKINECINALKANQKQITVYLVH